MLCKSQDHLIWSTWFIWQVGYLHGNATKEAHNIWICLTSNNNNNNKKKTQCDKNVFTATTGFVSRNKLIFTKHQAKLDGF